MKNHGAMVSLLVLGCTVTGCIELRDEIFHGQPSWESKRFDGLIQHSRTETNIAEACRKPPAGYQLTNQVGLSKLARQVLDEDVKVLATERFETYTAEAETNPLPNSLAKDDVMIAMVRILIREYETLGVAVRCKGSNPELDTKLPNTWLWRTELKDFGHTLVQTLWNDTYDDANPLPFVGEADDKDVPLLKLLKAYFMEYYSGEYVDRYGTKYSKPQVDFSITNEVIVAIVNILYEAIDDYALIGVREKLKDPIVFDWTTDNKIVYLNKTNAEPTFARFLRKTLLKAKNEPKTLPGVLEQVVTTGKLKGLTKQEVCVVHYLAGLSGEASEGLTAMIVRSIGGTNAGAPVLLGKFSIGDNQTVAKLIDAAVETQIKRSADALFSHIFHTFLYEDNMTLESGKQDIGWNWLAKHLKLSEILTCFSRKAKGTDPS